MNTAFFNVLFQFNQSFNHLGAMLFARHQPNYGQVKRHPQLLLLALPVSATQAPLHSITYSHSRKQPGHLPAASVSIFDNRRSDISSCYVWGARRGTQNSQLRALK